MFFYKHFKLSFDMIRLQKKYVAKSTCEKDIQDTIMMVFH